MIFTYGKQEHVYVQLNAKAKKALDKVMGYCRSTGEDINDFLGPILDSAANKALKELEASKREASSIMHEVESL
jgi:hypothetical protein